MSSEQKTNMEIDTSKESPQKEEPPKSLSRNIILTTDEAIESYFVDNERGSGRRNGSEFERTKENTQANGRGRRRGRARESMSPDTRERVERWLEGCRRAGCDGFMGRGVGGIGGEEERGDDVDLEVDEEEVENGGVNKMVEGKVDEEKAGEKIWAKEEPGVSSR
jgi:hypothetical protein